MKTDVLSNLHTHTVFCDGKATPEELVQKAIALGMETLGFSGHAYTPFDDGYTMSPESTEQYCNEVRRLQREYAERLHILLGVEEDLFAPRAKGDYDFRIGSVHYVCMDGEYCSVDDTFEILERAVTKHCKGDWYRLTRAYYNAVASVADKTDCDIVGHFDLVSKFNEKFPRFDERDPRYVGAAIEALDFLLERDVVFEVNTGAMSRAWRRLPYPLPIFLHRIAEKRGRVMLSSDAHTADALLYGFRDASAILRASGISSVWTVGRNGWKQIGI